MGVNFDEIDFVLLDLGGVILDIDYQRTIDAFQALGFENFDLQYSQMKQSGLFDELETGKIDENEFVKRIQLVLPNTSHDAIVEAWNALLLDFPPGRILTVQAITNRFPTCLLSNTNEIHYRSFTQTFLKHVGTEHGSFKSLFKKAYLSHEIKCRKPDKEAFECVLFEQGWDPNRTLFVDDSPQHLVGAAACGLKTHWLNGADSLEKLFGPVLT